PSDFYIDFTQNGVRYRYELTTTRTLVIREAVYKKVTRKTPLLERKHNSITYRTSDLAGIDLIILRDNASIIDTVEHYKLKDIGDDLSNIHRFFSTFGGNVHGFGIVSDTTLYNYGSISKLYHEHPEALSFASKIIQEADLGISG
ncbi:hypothetical protein APX70_04214, partial [Pseudomonas syringae pv. maculicola]